MGMVRDIGQPIEWLPGEMGILLRYETHRVSESVALLQGQGGVLRETTAVKRFQSEAIDGRE
jgi:hypothetical protein